MRQDFWTAFGKSYRRKWILYDTKIKGLAFKFHFGLKTARVSMDVDHHDLETRIALWEKLDSLQSILKEQYLPEALFEDCFLLDNQKEISRIYVEKKGVCIHNKDTWRETMQFLDRNMRLFEGFFKEYREILDP